MRGKIPENVDFIILLYDYVNHNLAYKIKKLAVNRNIPIVYAKRSWSSIYQKIVTIQRKYIRIYLTLDARKAGILLVRGIYCCRY